MSNEEFVLPGFSGGFGAFYNIAKDIAATAVLAACVAAAYRRVITNTYIIPNSDKFSNITIIYGCKYSAMSSDTDSISKHKIIDT